MPELTFDEFGMPVWTNGADATGSDPEPIAAAIAAVNSIGTPQNPIQDYRQPSPDIQPVGQPPSPDDPRNYLLNPNDDSREYATGPEPLAPVGSGVASGPAPAPGVPQVGTAPVPASSPVPVQAGKMDPVAAANAAVEGAQVDAAQAGMDVGLAANEAARMLAERRALAQEQHVGRQAQSDAQYQALRDQAQRDADTETAQWMGDLEAQAKKEPNPKRWFANQSSFGKIMWLASLAFGTKAAASAPGVQNIGLAMMREEMDKDMSEQKARLAREYEVTKLRGGAIDKKLAQKLAFLNDDHSIRAGQLLALEKASMERANAPGSADDQAAMMAAHKWLSEQRLGTAATRAQQAYQTKEAALSRAHAAGMQRNAQAFEREQNQLNRDERASLEALKLAFQAQDNELARQAKASGAKADLAAKQQTFDPGTTGLTTKDGKPVTLTVTDKEKSARYDTVQTLADTAQTVNAELELVRKANERGDLMSRLLNGDFELTQAVTRLGYSSAKENDPRGIVTDADFQNGIKSALGLRMDTATGRFSVEINALMNGKVGTKDYIREAIDKSAARLEARTNARINATLPQEEGGGQVVWRAKSRNATDTGTPNLARSQAAFGVDTKIDEPVSRASLNEALAKEKAGATDALPPYAPESQEKVSAAKDHFTGMSASEIEKAKPDALKQVMKDNRAFLEVDQLADKAADAAKAAEEELRATIKARAIARVSGLQRGGPLTRTEVAQMVTRTPELNKMTQNSKFMDDLMKAVDAVNPIKKAE